MVVDWDLTRKDRGHEGDGSIAPSKEASHGVGDLDFLNSAKFS